MVIEAAKLPPAESPTTITLVAEEPEKSDVQEIEGMMIHSETIT